MSKQISGWGVPRIGADTQSIFNLSRTPQFPSQASASCSREATKMGGRQLIKYVINCKQINNISFLKLFWDCLDLRKQVGIGRKYSKCPYSALVYLSPIVCSAIRALESGREYRSVQPIAPARMNHSNLRFKAVDHLILVFCIARRKDEYCYQHLAD